MNPLRPTDRTALVTHRGCLDGTGSALMFLLAGGNRKNILFRPPNNCALSDIESIGFDQVWFADLCPADLYKAAGEKPIRVFDHHISNQSKWSGNPLCVFDMNKSGTSLMASVLGIDDHQRMISSLEAYDLGRFDDVDGMFLADLATSYSQEEMLDVLYDYGNGVFELGEFRGRVEGAASVRKLFAEAAAKSAHYFEFKPPGWGDASGTVNAGIAASPIYWKNAVADEILKKAELAIIVDVVGGMASLRSRTVDCSTIAGAMGGGGHKVAAGFKINGKSVLGRIIDEVFG